MAAAAAQGYDELVLRLLDAGCPTEGFIRASIQHCSPATMRSVLASMAPEALPRLELDQAFEALVRTRIGSWSAEGFISRLHPLAEFGANLDCLDHYRVHNVQSVRHLFESNARWLRAHTWSTSDVPRHEHLSRHQDYNHTAGQTRLSPFMQAVVMDIIFQEPHFSDQVLTGLIKWTYVQERANFRLKLAV
eukprot:TRINITY_DN12327_c1_g3_i1.p2 TRINITY_DN12327_c1_g3~~TRINITY_DN12327_c1_g3_i1.p2  ORF type:complete len:191 (+),score=25.36 TRINITY_DN12327_c1_g3_i1:997-1569(+)